MADRDPVQLAADVIREAVTCDRSQCTPDDHQRYVTENMQIAHQRISEQTAGGGH
ncbi:MULTISPECIES: hypothetical protein [unclassified Streptomyces]|uniref:hypothetical protein n=1 Tax=unclassified Streptomyces TaxID=2593676 RepID=UPI000A846111|nr:MULTISPECIES: hypothetical protein [unclassified Streptomyces]WSI29220.1 hypothetical protein OG311_38125 [Streptomyces sp. NBC_01343]